MRCLSLHALGLLAISLPLVLAGGCVPKGSAVNPGTRTPIQSGTSPDGSRGGPSWFPRAVDLRVHPATRYVEDHGELLLEARVELLDQQGEPIKDVGSFYCELAAVDENGQLVMVEGQPRMLKFSLEVMTAAQHAEYWDPVARAYIVPMQIDEADRDFTGGLTRLWVTFRPAWPGADQIPASTADRKPVDIRVDW